jgi:hypothetical protein
LKFFLPETENDEAKMSIFSTLEKNAIWQEKEIKGRCIRKEEIGVLIGKWHGHLFGNS